MGRHLNSLGKKMYASLSESRLKDTVLEENNPRQLMVSKFLSKVTLAIVFPSFSMNDVGSETHYTNGNLRRM
jgi:hypothetical protein